MSRRNRQWKDNKKKRDSGGFSAIPHSVTDSQAYANLSGWAVKLLLDLARSYNGKNNGDIAATWKLMKPRGWNSPMTLKAAEKELNSAGFIFLTR